MEILAVFQAKISVSDELCISGDTATITLPEYAIQPHYRYSAAGDDLAQHGAGPTEGS